MSLVSVDGAGTALPQDLPDLIHLWSLCFEEDETEAAYFPTRRFCPEQTYVWRREGKVCSVIYLIPVQGNGYRGGYLYAIGTHPDLQGQGIFTRLHQYVTEQAAAEGLDFLCLIPATRTLFSLYGRLGYESWYERERLSVTEFSQEMPCLPSVAVSVRDCTPEEYIAAMQPLLTQSFPQTSAANPAYDFFKRQINTLASVVLHYETETDQLLVLQQHLHYDGFLKHCTGRNTSFVLAGSVEDKTLYLSQCSCTDSETLLQAAAFLAEQFSCDQLFLPPTAPDDYLRLPAGACIPHSPLSTVKTTSPPVPYAMGLWLSQNHPTQPAPTLGLMYT